MFLCNEDQSFSIDSGWDGDIFFIAIHMVLGFRCEQNSVDNTLGVLGTAELCLHSIKVACLSHSSKLVVGKILGQDTSDQRYALSYNITLSKKTFPKKSLLVDELTTLGGEWLL